MKSFLQEIESKFVDLEEQDQGPIDPSNLDAVGKKADDLLAKINQLKVAIGEQSESDEEIDEAHCGSHDKTEEIDEAHCGSHDKTEEIDEASNTAGISGGEGPPQVPAAFAKPGKWKNKDKTYETVQEAMDRKYERLIESYTTFSRGDKKMTPENKVKRTIQEVSKKLKEIETLVKHTSKLKEESGISRKEYGPRTEKALNKISEKLIKIAERVRAIGE